MRRSSSSRWRSSGAASRSRTAERSRGEVRRRGRVAASAQWLFLAWPGGGAPLWPGFWPVSPGGPVPFGQFPCASPCDPGPPLPLPLLPPDGAVVVVLALPPPPCDAPLELLPPPCEDGLCTGRVVWLGAR